MSAKSTVSTEISTEQLIDLGISSNTAPGLSKQITKILETHSNEACWQKLSKDILKPDHPFALHQFLYEAAYQNWDEESNGPPPAWIPDEKTVQQANVTKFRDQLNLDSYKAFYSWSVNHRKAFWETMVQDREIIFKQPYNEVVKVKDSLEHPRWLVDGELNIADSCFNAPPETTAIVYQEEGGQMKRMSYEELEHLSNRVANGLTQLGIKKGDAVAIDMVMTAEAVAIYLGIVKTGAAVVSIADSLAPAEVEKRLDIADAKLVFTQDVIVRGGKELPLYPKILEAHPDRVVVLPGKAKLSADLREQDMGWSSFLSDDTDFTSVTCQPEDVCNILFSSGTTGTPKAIPWSHTTPIRCAVDGYLHQDIHPEEVVAWPTNIGWMMGPWLIFASLINQATIALYYGMPTVREFGKFVEQANVNMLGVVPSMVKQWKDSDCMKGLDWSGVKCFSSTGEASSPVDYHWLMARGGYKPVIEYCGGTEIGGGYATGTMVQPAVPAAFSTPAVGLDYVVFNENGQPDRAGELFLVPPAIGLSLELLNKDHHEVYFEDTPECPDKATGVFGDNIAKEVEPFNQPPVLRRHGDEIRLMPNGYARAMGRADDTMNIGGIKVSSKEIERLLEVMDNVHEVAAIAASPPEGGPAQLVVYTVQKEQGETNAEQFKKAFRKKIKEELNPLFKVGDVVLVEELPRTASNKVMRRVLRDQYENDR